jgi:general stress protein 26
MSEKPTDEATVKRACLRVMSESEAVYVTTLDEEGAPCTRAMENLRRVAQYPSARGVWLGHDEDLLTYLATNTSSEKMRHVGRDPRASLYYCLPGIFHGVMLGGRIEVESDPAVGRALWQEKWTEIFPQGFADPDYSVLRLRPTRLRGWLSEFAFDVRLGSGG